MNSTCPTTAHRALQPTPTLSAGRVCREAPRPSFVTPANYRASSLRRWSRGFTLLEMMMVAAIITILVMIALPSYDAHVRRSKRASAQSHLMDVAARQQQYLFDNRAFAADLTALNMTTPSDVAASYTITVSTLAGPPPSFTITATPTGNQVKDLAGAALTITNSGAKAPSGAW